jgi:hypothetical protein
VQEAAPQIGTLTEAVEAAEVGAAVVTSKEGTIQLLAVGLVTTAVGFAVQTLAPKGVVEPA